MTRKALLTLVAVLAVAFPALAQKITVKGTVYEPEGEPAIGASVTVKGTTGFGVATDFDGNYSIQCDPTATLVVSYVGCDNSEIPVNGQTTIDVHLKVNSVAMSELVVIGYGVVKKSDATGAVGVVKPNEVQAGLASTAQDLLVGASPGVVVSTKGGSPTDGAAIQIRGGASLNASNDPLIVIDGVPMTSYSVTGSSNPLSLVAPDNIESMTILKDASATAIFGSRASNGVIIITTKSGRSGKPQVSFAANFYVATPRNYLDMMDGNEFRSYILNRYGAGSPQAAALGDVNTNWQKEALRTAFSQDYSLSVGGTVGFLPYNVSVSYTGTEGVIKTTHNRRLSGSLNLTPKFFDNLLSVNANVKGAYIQNRYEQGVLGGATAFNPTLPVHQPNKFGNWTTYVGGGLTADEETPTSAISTLYAVNPISRLHEYDRHSKVYQSVGNLQLDLKMPFLEELRANLNLGYDYSHGNQTSLQLPGSPQAWLDGFSYYAEDMTTINLKDGYTNKNYNNQTRYSLLLDFYLNYNKEFDAIKSSLDVTAGYSWQRFNNKGANWAIVDPSIFGNTTPLSTPANLGTAENPVMAYTLGEMAGYQFGPTSYYKSRYQLVSFFGRVNYGFKDRYLLTATVRRDGTSRFGKENRWGTFPSFSLAWRISEESFMENTKSYLNDLKLRASYGTTGQQDLNEDYFPYLPVYANSIGDNPTYPIDGQYVNTVWPSKYNAALKWETTHTWNVGLDFGFLNNRINGSLEFYVRKTSDLLVYANYPAGSNIGNTGWINLGDLRNTGIEFNINTRPIVTNDFTWNSNLNLAWNKNKITRLAEGADTATGSIGDGVTIQKHMEGMASFTYYVLEQVYDEQGNPIEGAFVDQNADGVINGDDYIYYHHVHPDITVSWHNTFNYKNWDLGFVLRGAFGNWAYNKNQMDASFVSRTATAPLSNLMSNTFLFEQARTTEHMVSSYFVQNASFVRCDNITLGYTWQNLLQNKLRVRLFAAVQNPFVITKYKGLDPELTAFQGIDSSVYPRPTTYTLGVTATF